MTKVMSDPSTKSKRAKGERAQKPTLTPAAEKYARGSVEMSKRDLKNKPKRLRMTMESLNEGIIASSEANAAAEVLLPADEGMIEADDSFKTFKLKQSTIREEVDINTASKMLDLKLTKFGPYRTSYSRNGRFMLMAGQKGHVAVMDCHRMTLGAEMQLQETVHDVCYLHNESLFAVAQHKYAYIYDSKGAEIHCMKKHERPHRLDFLPYHFLLVTTGHSGWVKWHDVSTGEYVAGYSSGHGPCRVLKHNPYNAVSFMGHANGVVSLWSPAAGKPLASMFCHKSPVTDLALDRSGQYLVTAGADKFLKVWDIRTYRCLHAYKPDKPVSCVDVSDKGLIAIGVGRCVQVLKDAFMRPTDVTYLRHEISSGGAPLSSGSSVAASVQSLKSSVSLNNVAFRPFEDVLAVGHSHGVSTLVVPGAGEANFDSMENNPYQNPRQRRESEIQSLLYKLKPDMISLDPFFVGTVDKDSRALQADQRELLSAANNGLQKGKKEKNRKRGRNKISAKLRRKQKNVVDAQTVKLKEEIRKREDEIAKSKGVFKKEERMLDKFSALKRFQKNPQ